jgi:hypothetical protein
LSDGIEGRWDRMGDKMEAFPSLHALDVSDATVSYRPTGSLTLDLWLYASLALSHHHIGRCATHRHPACALGRSIPRPNLRLRLGVIRLAARYAALDGRHVRTEA